jgi:hypothetical protein
MALDPEKTPDHNVLEAICVAFGAKRAEPFVAMATRDAATDLLT